MPELATLALFFGVALVLAAMPGPNAPSAFRQGVIVEAPNPKTAAFVLALIPHSLTPPGAASPRSSA